MSKHDLIEYKNYYGSVHFDAKEELFYGKIEYIRDLVNFEASDAKSLVQSFKDSVDDYLEECRALNKTPDASFKGSFNIRITPELHREIGLYALQHDSSINGVVKSALKEFMQQQGHA
ncbi:MAG: toxin-antitoxin system HicB family antitoxin [Rickettsiales bacterium]|nr:MAG: toxin-antitoxin system HicB family antitoxin [Rickettsiales bacterium]